MWRCNPLCRNFSRWYGLFFSLIHQITVSRERSVIVGFICHLLYHLLLYDCEGKEHTTKTNKKHWPVFSKNLSMHAAVMVTDSSQYVTSQFRRMPGSRKAEGTMTATGFNLCHVSVWAGAAGMFMFLPVTGQCYITQPVIYFARAHRATCFRL